MKIKTRYGGQVLCVGLIAGLALGAGCNWRKVGREKLPPEITGVQIRPDPPSAGVDLNASVQYHTESESAVVLDFRWLVNGQVKLEGTGKNVLPGALVTPGAMITVEVQPRNAERAGSWVSANPVKIGEKAVVKLKGVSLEPKEAFRNTTLEAKVDAGDVAPESLTLYYRWRVNEQVVENASDPTLGHDAFHHGDYVMVEVSTDPDFASSQTVGSLPIKINNLPPEIKSGFNFTWDGEKYIYQMEATDPDDDPLTYFLEKGPAGMTVDSKTGLVTWKPGPNAAAGVYEVRVGVDDGQGGKVGQQERLNLSPAQPAPSPP